MPSTMPSAGSSPGSERYFSYVARTGCRSRRSLLRWASGPEKACGRRNWRRSGRFGLSRAQDSATRSAVSYAPENPSRRISYAEGWGRTRSAGTNGPSTPASLPSWRGASRQGRAPGRARIQQLRGMLRALGRGRRSADRGPCGLRRHERRSDWKRRCSPSPKNSCGKVIALEVIAGDAHRAARCRGMEHVVEARRRGARRERLDPSNAKVRPRPPCLRSSPGSPATHRVPRLRARWRSAERGARSGPGPHKSPSPAPRSCSVSL